MRSKTNDSLQYQLARIQENLLAKYSNYRKNSVLLMANPELAKDRMLVDEINMKKGIEILLDTYNSNLRSDFQQLFIYYGDNRVFAAEGLSRVPTFFSTLSQEEKTSASEIIASPSEGMYYFGGDYFLLHFPLWDKTDSSASSVNYCVNLSAYAEELSSLLQSGDSYLRIVFANGRTACFSGDTQSGLSLVNTDSNPAQVDLADWTTLETQSDLLGVRFLVSWNPEDIYSDIINYQVFNLIAMTLLILLAAFVSYVSGRWQYNPIRKLAEATSSALARHKPESLGANNEYDYIKSGLSWMLLENNRLGSEVAELQALTRRQVAYRLFQGIYIRKEDAQAMLQLCDIEMHEEFFAVACIRWEGNLADVPLLLNQIEQEFPETLCADVSTDGSRMIGVFIQLPSEDYLCRKRLEVGEKIQKLAEHIGLSVLIGFSQAYDNFNVISYAWLEGIIVLREPGHTGGIYIWEKIIKPDQDISFPADEKLVAFEQALALKDEKKAGYLLDELLQESTHSRGGQETQILVVCSYLLHALIMAIRNDKDGCNQNLLLVATRINPADIHTFAAEMKTALNLFCRPVVNEIDFKKVLAYIDQHYANPDLSLDEVSEFAGLSKSYLSRLFQRKTSKRYIDYLTSLRMESARQLLTNTSIPIREIAKMAGYYDVPGFRKKFKSFFGINASAYRKNEVADSDSPGKANLAPPA